MDLSPILPLLEQMEHTDASDLYLTAGVAPCLRIDDHVSKLGAEPLSVDELKSYIRCMTTAEQQQEYALTHELDFAITDANGGRYRVNLLVQQQQPAMVIRRVRTSIPSIEELGLPPLFGTLSLLKRGLVLIVGQTGSGKSTTMASMLAHRNEHGEGHIITIEDPIEFVHDHKRCIFTQREIGIDTDSYTMALRQALRQRPDVVAIGEIRDAESMDHAVRFAETGHLCIATLHASNSVQALERILGFFEPSTHRQKLGILSETLKAIVSQRLVLAIGGGRTLALEVMLNRGLIAHLIREGNFQEILNLIHKAGDQGMIGFDQSLLALCRARVISEETAISEADNQINMKLALKSDQIEKAGHTLSNGLTPTTPAASASTKAAAVNPLSIYDSLNTALKQGA